MKKLMILGASYSQLPLYKMAKKLGDSYRSSEHARRMAML